MDDSGRIPKGNTVSSGNITKEELLQIIISNEALMDEIIFSEWEKGTHQEKCINIGDAIFAAIQDFKKAKLKKHQSGLLVKVRHISEEENQESENISSDNQRFGV